MAEQTNFELFRGTNVTLRFQLTVPEPEPNYVTGWTTQFRVKVKETDANTVLTVNGAISSVTNALELGIFDVVLSANNTATLADQKKYAYSFRRIDAGYEDVLAYGELTAKTAS